MSGSTIIFYLLAALTLVSGIVAVTTRQIFRAAISLLFSLIGVAGIYFWLQLEFIAAVQTVVYVGGIVVLIIFSIFLTHQAGEKLPKQTISRNVFSGLAAFCGFALVMIQIGRYSFTGSGDRPMDASVAAIGREMLSVDKNGYALPFEVISMLLLAALIGCVVIALRSPTMILPKKGEPDGVTNPEENKVPAPSKNKVLSPVEDPEETE